MQFHSSDWVRLKEAVAHFIGPDNPVEQVKEGYEIIVPLWVHGEDLDEGPPRDHEGLPTGERLLKSENIICYPHHVGRIIEQDGEDYKIEIFVSRENLNNGW